MMRVMAGLILLAIVAAGIVLWHRNAPSGGPKAPELAAVVDHFPPPYLPAAPEATQGAIQPAPLARMIAPERFSGPDVGRATVIVRLPDRPTVMPTETGPPIAVQPALKFELLFNPVATEAGMIEAGGHSIKLRGIRAFGSDETCADNAGASWPCGMRARTAFRSWLRGRAIHCKVPELPGAETLETECLVAGEDPAAWLVAQGWAKPDSEDVADEQRQADATGAGAHGE
jgi:endonuclease YncB( thermonuclease family)